MVVEATCEKASRELKDLLPKNIPSILEQPESLYNTQIGGIVDKTNATSSTGTSFTHSGHVKRRRPRGNDAGIGCYSQNQKNAYSIMDKAADHINQTIRKNDGPMELREFETIVQEGIEHGLKKTYPSYRTEDPNFSRFKNGAMYFLKERTTSGFKEPKTVTLLDKIRLTKKGNKIYFK